MKRRPQLFITRARPTRSVQLIIKCGTFRTPVCLVLTHKARDNSMRGTAMNHKKQSDLLDRGHCQRVQPGSDEISASCRQNMVYQGDAEKNQKLCR